MRGVDLGPTGPLAPSVILLILQGTDMGSILRVWLRGLDKQEGALA